MARQNRHFLPGYHWHLTHRCHDREFLLKFLKDRDCWRRWLYECRKRYGLQILNFSVMSNHIHLLVKSVSESDISDSMQLLASQTGQRYNRRKSRKGSFWEGRYHGTAIVGAEHLWHCMMYIDYNPVRAGLVHSPLLWGHNGCVEILNDRQKYWAIDHGVLLSSLEVNGMEELRVIYQETQEKYKERCSIKDSRWTRSLAIGPQGMLQDIQEKLSRSERRSLKEHDDGLVTLREPESHYGAENMALSCEIL